MLLGVLTLTVIVCDENELHVTSCNFAGAFGRLSSACADHFKSQPAHKLIADAT